MGMLGRGGERTREKIIKRSRGGENARGCEGVKVRLRKVRGDWEKKALNLLRRFTNRPGEVRSNWGEM